MGFNSGFKGLSPRTINYVQGVIPMAVYGAHRTINTLASVSLCRIHVLSCKNMALVLSDAQMFCCLYI